MILALSTPASIATIAALVLVLLATRVFGRWLIRRGGAIESRRHGPLPGGYMDPGKPRRPEDEQAQDPAEPDRYDPFDAG